MTPYRQTLVLFLSFFIWGNAPAFAQIGPGNFFSMENEILRHMQESRAPRYEPYRPRRVYRPSYSRSDIAKAQRLLNQLGYEAGAVDGMMGSRTRRAIATFQSDDGLAVTGRFDGTLLAELHDAVASGLQGSTTPPKTQQAGTNAVPTSTVPWAPGCTFLDLGRGRIPTGISGEAPADDVICYAIKPISGSRISIKVVSGQNIIFSIKDRVDAVDHYSFLADGSGYVINVGQLMRAVQSEPFRISISGGQSESVEALPSPSVDASRFSGTWTGNLDGEGKAVIKLRRAGTYDVDIQVSVPGSCGGNVSGPAKLRHGQLVLSASEYGETCVVTMTPTARGLRLEPSSGCSMFHGAACSFSGTLRHREQAGLGQRAPSVTLQTGHKPRRGSSERVAILDAVRPEAVKYLGPPVAFVVDDLKVSGDRAYASLTAQRPGGIKIDLKDTPWGRRQPVYDPSNDYPGIEALLQRRGEHWFLAEFRFSWTEPPFADPKHCQEWREVLPKVWCQ